MSPRPLIFLVIFISNHEFGVSFTSTLVQIWCETPSRSAIGAQGLKLLVMQSLKIVATHTFGSREYRLDAELVLIIGPLFPIPQRWAGARKPG